MLKVFQSLPIPAHADDIVTAGNLPGCSLAFLLAELAVQYTHPFFVITADRLSAARLEAEIRFFSSDPTLPILHFPDWETLPYDQFSPDNSIISQRIAAMYRIGTLKRGIIITAINTILQRLAPPNFVQKNSFVLNQGDHFDIQESRERCTQQGYYSVSQVLEPGEFCTRGGIFDIFPTGSNTPFRIEIFDDKVESIRTFDPETQRTLERISTISLLPAREFPLTDDSIVLFRQQWRDHFNGNPTMMPIYNDVSQGIMSTGIEYYLPLFFQDTATLLQYLPTNTRIIQWGDCANTGRQFWQEIHYRFHEYHVDASRPLLPPKKLYISIEELGEMCHQFPQIKLHTDSTSYHNFAIHAGQDVFIDYNSTQPLQALQEYLLDYPNTHVLFCAESIGRRERILELFNRYQIFPTLFDSWPEFIQKPTHYGITVAPLDQGMFIPDANLMIITENQLFGFQVAQKSYRHSKAQTLDHVIRHLAELKIGAAVVHEDYGVGRYVGLQNLEQENITNEYLILQYADGDILYVPVTHLHLISRYGGLDNDQAPLDKLGSKRWQQAKAKAAKQIKDVAANLLAIYAAREYKLGTRYQLPESEYYDFAAKFRFEETPDQAQAIHYTIQDMCSEKHMDRLICGDVGFGKTEVAMRAAFICVYNKKQVVVLVPTTLLAQQHYTTFQDRFADWPITIECLSRFRTQKEQQSILERLQAGKIDIIIGTHKLIQDHVQYHDLGLVIIDEEHRFGVQQKERFKQLRSEVDILTLTATPIPRTLNLAISQVRDLSIIATPPARRLAVKTFIQVRNQQAIREAIQREILRGGQVYFLHNSIESIHKVARELMELAPKARIEVAHGQMRARELEHIMSNFYHQRFNVLVCTSIIETGIDIPTANTIIIDQADSFGLAQLHQLRGRVGRSHHQAYAYLLTRPLEIITPDAKKRLEAFASLNNLGAGFLLATHDLEIRGAGDVLGEEQSGHIQTIGLTLYTELLNKAVHSLQTGILPSETTIDTSHTIVDIKMTALIPNDFVIDVHERLLLYKRLANAKTFHEINELKIEIIDRFGLLPQPTQHLLAITHIKLQAEQLGIQKLEAHVNGCYLHFKANPNINSITIIKLIQTQADKYQLISNDQLKIKWQISMDDILEKVQNLLVMLCEKSD